MWKIESPGGCRDICIELTPQGSMTYRVSAKGEICAGGNMGLVTTLGDFTRGLSFVSMEEVTTIQETYSLPVGKKAVYENCCVETRLHFSCEAMPLVLAVRAYDNGVAFRYEIPVESAPAGEAFAVVRENTDFAFPEGFEDVWLQSWVATYEAPYDKTAWGRACAGRHYAMPALIGGEGRAWVMVNEANVLNAGGNYCISHLRGTQERRLVLDFAPEEKGQPVPSTLPFQSPWRYLLVEDTLDGVVNSTLNYNLNPPSILEETDWIKPGRALWAWWCADTGAQEFIQAKQYVDYAAAMGFEAVVIDAGWDETWIQQFCAYAHACGVSPWLWTGMQAIDTYEKANYYLPLWKRWGADGVKIDIFENDSAHTAWQYNMMADIMAREKLMVNFHGCTKPMGEGRTWPHFITAEGVMSLEYYKWSDMPHAEHNCTLPFIRNAAGPMDYTPVGFTNENRNTSLGHQLALTVVYESGCTHFASSIYNLEPWKGTDFLRRIKPKYDGLRLLGGYPGDFVTMLRWVEATEEYLIGCICNQKRREVIALDFLPEGAFEAELYTDDRFGNVVVCETLAVTRDTVLDISMPEHGGAALYIARKIEPLTIARAENYMCDAYTELSMAAASVHLGSVHEDVSDEYRIPILTLKGGATLPCAQDIPRGEATVRLFYLAHEACTLQMSDGMTTVRVALPPSGYGVAFAVHDVVFPFAGGPTKLLFTLLSGTAPKLDKLRIIDNHPAQRMRLPVETAVLQGRGALLEGGAGDWQMEGMTEGSRLCFEGVMVAKAGDYVLRIDYCAGLSGTASVRVNEGEALMARLNGVGMWSAAKPGDTLARELLVPLQKGANHIELRAEETLPPIKMLGLTACAD